MELIPRFQFLRKKAVTLQLGGRTYFNVGAANSLFQQIGLNLSSNIDCKTVTGQAQAYALNPIVNGVINARATAATQGIWKVVDSEDNEVKSDFDKFLDRPNPIQSWQQFVNNANIFKDIFGRCYIYPLKSDAAVNRFTTAALWIIPNWLVAPRLTGRIWMQSNISQIVECYDVMGFSSPVKPEDMIVWDDTSINTSQNSNELVIFQSRLYGLSDQVSNILRAYEARRKIMNKGGPPGAWVNDNAKDAAGQNPKTPKEIAEAQNEFQQYGLGNNNQYLYAILSSAWKWVQAGSPTKDLMLFEEVKDSAQIITFVYNLPEHLAPWGGDKTFNNVTASEKKFYNNAIIPCNQDLGKVISVWFGLDKKGQLLKPFFDHLECFQSDRKAEAEAINSIATAMDKFVRNTTITPTESRKILGTYLDTTIFNPDKPEGEFFTETQTPENNGTQ